MNLQAQETVVGFIGIGVMGRSMASHLMAAGYPLNIYNRTQAKAEELLDRGASWRESPAAVAAHSEIIITMLGYPRDVEEVYLGPEGLLAHCRTGSVVIDMTTSSPQLAEKIAAAARQVGIAALDAPVSGGDIGAREGTLSIMVGGERNTFEQVRPLLACMGKNIVFQGTAGSGQHCKMANQIAIASTMMGVCEAMVYAEKAGLTPETVLESIASGAAGSWSLSNLAPRMLAGDLEPGFYVKHFIKDMNIALESSEEIGLSAQGLALAKSMYDRLAAAGDGELGTQALYKAYR
ncbi:NAD(P)-dependent oxidoreductase [Desulfogranum mediterraneum]|uniref:NAD(P)-dependent oxidoreductase n=1 Tax=Desulfogranum mediterraneum TaxID=160661 RepID=UPI00040F9484|nr:NAD(P)-dependent oxidoreductase [Desulfogranum mediterraneum]